MSKAFKTISRAALLIGLSLAAAVSARAQTLEAKLRIVGTDAFVEGRMLDGTSAQNVTNFSFLKSYAGFDALGARLSGVELRDENDRPIAVKKLVDGEYLAEKPFRSWRYKITLDASKTPSAAAHVSSLAGDRGILMTADLLPEFAEKTTARLALELPPEWRAATLEKNAGENVFEIANLEKAVIYVGAKLRETEIATAGNARIRLVAAGEWQVTGDEAARMTREIAGFYEKMFGGRSFDAALVFLGKFPPGVKTGRWEAETRGASVTILSSEMDFITQSVQRLHEQLRHEIFHLWFPNGVALAGSYDWFYEGFALYASLRAAVAMNRIRFDDFLDTLGRAHSVDQFQTQRLPLVEAAKNRWNGANTQVYARGMLVAFLIDVALLGKSKGKTALADLLGEIYRKYRVSTVRPDGSAAILGEFAAHQELRTIVEKYVKGAADIAWQTDLEPAGIESKTENFTTKLTVKADLNGRQKDLLDKLGYNNWRKISESSK
ncbi:MAG: hypothetical protein JSS81_06365 [Acidobacteria bacterium]|nr:hypothetical protein [Acidobacteriota bacterium]